jgi:hypothetical protein
MEAQWGAEGNGGWGKDQGVSPCRRAVALYIRNFLLIGSSEDVRGTIDVAGIWDDPVYFPATLQRFSAHVQGLTPPSLLMACH